MAAETGLLIDGTIYELPDINSFTIDECQVLYDYSGLTLDDFVPLDGETDDDHLARIERMMRNPGWRKTMLHVAYQRGNPKLPAQRVKDLVGTANWLEPFTAMGDEPAEDDAIPPASTSERNEPSPRSSLENDSTTEHTNGNGGTGSTTDGNEQDTTPPGTGVLRSDTSPTWPHATSAA